MNQYHRLVRHFYNDKLKERANVVGTGLGKRIRDGELQNEDAILVLVEKKMPEYELKLEDCVPKSILGARLDVVEVGKLVTHATFDPRKRIRPIIAGTSIGGPTWAGTLGCFAVNRIRGDLMHYSRPVILTNAHVADRIRQNIYQPGGADSIATKDNFIGIVTRILYPNDSGGLVDCATVALSVLPSSYLIPNIGGIIGVADAVAGETCRKSGRTSGFTVGKVLALGVNTEVDYGEGKAQVVRNQVLLGPMSAPGDSGSLIVNGKNFAVGLLFAGSDRVTLANPIKTVVNKLNVKIL